MKYTIKEQVNPTNTFQVEVTFMHGDADAYTTIDINAGIVCTDATPILEYFLAHMGERDYDEESEYFEYVSSDIHYGCDFSAYVDEIKLYWYNSQGSKYEVSYEA
jgi:hypothetical protein